MKTIIERGASWTLEETKLLLGLWGQDLIQRSATGCKRTKETYEKIAERFIQNGYERTADQVRTRVFNMIAEYRRILKDPSPERIKKCIFFEALHKIYQAQHMDDIKSALDDYDTDFPSSPASATISLEKGDESISDSEATEPNEGGWFSPKSISAIGATNSKSNNSVRTSAVAGGSGVGSGTGSTSGSNNNTQAGADDNNGNLDGARKTNSGGGVSEKESPSHTTSAQSAKKIKVEHKSADKQSATTAVSASTSNANSSASTSSSDQQNSNSKNQTKTSSTSTTTVTAITIGPSTSAASSLSTSSNTQRHQSLLMPNSTGSSSTTSTPLSKLTTTGSGNTPSYININSTKLPIIRTNQLIGHSNGNESINLNGNTARLPTTAAITGTQLYQAPVNTFDVTSSALLIDRMFAHLAREHENMREWIALEKERLALERARRQQENEREMRRERVLTDTLLKYQEQWLCYIQRIDPRLLDNPNEPPPELKIPPRESGQNDSSQPTGTTSGTGTTGSSTQSESKP